MGCPVEVSHKSTKFNLLIFFGHKRPFYNTISVVYSYTSVITMYCPYAHSVLQILNLFICISMHVDRHVTEGMGRDRTMELVNSYLCSLRRKWLKVRWLAL